MSLGSPRPVTIVVIAFAERVPGLSTGRVGNGTFHVFGILLAIS